MDDRKAFPLRISKGLFDKIKAWSDQEMRSVNGQIEFLLREAVNKRMQNEKSTREESKPDEP
jgi:hypothetical protein